MLAFALLYVSRTTLPNCLARGNHNELRIRALDVLERMLLGLRTQDQLLEISRTACKSLTVVLNNEHRNGC